VKVLPNKVTNKNSSLRLAAFIPFVVCTTNIFRQLVDFYVAKASNKRDEQCQQHELKPHRLSLPSFHPSEAQIFRNNPPLLLLCVGGSGGESADCTG